MVRGTACVTRTESDVNNKRLQNLREDEAMARSRKMYTLGI